MRERSCAAVKLETETHSGNRKQLGGKQEVGNRKQEMRGSRDTGSLKQDVQG